jgi:hypothetical protein
MRATYTKFKDGYAVFLDSQDLPGGELMLRSKITELHAKLMVDQINWAIRSCEQRVADGIIHMIKEVKR